MQTTPPICDFGWQAPHFTLPATDGRQVSLGNIAGPRGTLIMFICNHCPYVLAILPRILHDARDLAALGVGMAAICCNDARAYPQDSFDNMTALALHHRFPFPYLHDETQDVARAYGASCTPDFFGFDANLGLQYRGRLDASGRTPAPGDTPRELFDAMRLIAQTGHGPAHQTPTIGCSIKWVSA